MAFPAASASGVAGGGILKPRSAGFAPRRPFSTASVALNARTLMEFTMSSMRAW